MLDSDAKMVEGLKRDGGTEEVQRNNRTPRLEEVRIEVD